MTVDVNDLRSIDFFAACSGPVLQDLASLCHRTGYRRLRTIHDEGAPVLKVYAVLRGQVVLHKAAGATGDPVRLAVVQAGEMFGFGEVMLPRYYTTARALMDCSLLEIGRDDFIRRFLAVAAIREQVLLALCKINRYLVNKLTGAGGVEDLALYLQTLAGECGRATGDRIMIQRKVRQPEVASVLNLSREHVTRLFARLKAQGVVDFNRGYPVIDQAWLEQAVRDKDLAASIQYRDAPL